VHTRGTVHTGPSFARRIGQTPLVDRPRTATERSTHLEYGPVQYDSGRVSRRFGLFQQVCRVFTECAC
jgi:hypothetical protein